jgi:hypothetical protein
MSDKPATKTGETTIEVSETVSVTVLLPRGCYLALQKLARADDLMTSDVVIMAVAHYKARKDAVARALVEM